MKIGYRKPSLKKMVASRISIKRRVSNKMRVPNGFGIFTNPKKAIYNRTYNKTTFNIFDIIKTIIGGCK